MGDDSRTNGSYSKTRPLQQLAAGEPDFIVNGAGPTSLSMALGSHPQREES